MIANGNVFMKNILILINVYFMYNLNVNLITSNGNKPININILKMDIYIQLNINLITEKYNVL